MSLSVRSPGLHALFSQGTIKQYARGETIGSTDQQDILFMLVQGYVKRYMIRNDGALGVQIIYGPQDVFSLTRIFQLLLSQSLYDGPETYYYTAMSDVTVFTLNAVLLTDCMQTNPVLYRELFGEAGRHLKACVHSIENISLHAIYPRVAHELAFMLSEFGRSAGTGKKLPLNITHQDIADILGVTRATVSLAVGKLREKGLILPGRCFATPDLTALASEAYSS
ncbi:MAG TPA: Crp/Fnr family transcriptional regulator [Nevskiaceae bacterium]|nr:Crp/Fnr family transcriptional regulator [Nevskiaceae bacterium]